jgi:hypothetical protein
MWKYALGSLIKGRRCGVCGFTFLCVRIADRNGVLGLFPEKALFWAIRPLNLMHGLSGVVSLFPSHIHYFENHLNFPSVSKYQNPELL